MPRDMSDNFYAGFVPRSGPVWRARQAKVRADYRKTLPLAEADREVERWTAENPRPRGTLADVADHVAHIRRIAGVEHVGLGADYYDPGGPSMAEGLDDLTRFPFLFAELIRRGWTDADLRKIAGENLFRAMRVMERKASELSESEPPSRARYSGW